MARSKPLDPEYSSRWVPSDFFRTFCWKEVFPTPQPVELELGAGDGSFLVQYASAHPQVNFFAVERLLGRVRKMDRKSHIAGCCNIRLLRVEASYLLNHLIPEASLQAIHLYFPDPWPKKKHHKNRLVNDHFANACHRLLATAGCVYLRTDHGDYFEQMEEVFAHKKGFEQTPTPAKLLAFKTDFEAHFNQRGIETQHACYLKKASSNMP